MLKLSTWAGGEWSSGVSFRKLEDTLLSPDLFVLIPIAVVGIKQAILPAVELDVFMGDNVNFIGKSARFLPSESAVQFVDQLPAL